MIGRKGERVRSYVSSIMSEEKNNKWGQDFKIEIIYSYDSYGIFDTKMNC